MQESAWSLAIRWRLLSRLAALMALLTICVAPIVSCGEGKDRYTQTTLECLINGLMSVLQSQGVYWSSIIFACLALLVVLSALVALLSTDVSLLALSGFVGMGSLWALVLLYCFYSYRPEPGALLLTAQFGVILLQVALLILADRGHNVPAPIDTG